MEIKDLKISVCMTAVEVVKNCMREFGAVCGNCKNLGTGNVCTALWRGVNAEDFCQKFEFRDEQSCLLLYQKIESHILAEAEDEESNHTTD